MNERKKFITEVIMELILLAHEDGTTADQREEFANYVKEAIVSCPAWNWWDQSTEEIREDMNMGLMLALLELEGI